jgi:alkanesulfonate monooxygenase SsuD/methylene tetrahydromethanopterin reductase-like flavin-dependent oxidoreductase (luciferase family)
MQFWSGTAFMDTSEAMAVARMFDEAGYDGIVCSDHMIYPRELALRRNHRRQGALTLLASAAAPSAASGVKASRL